jgi:5-methyltetrahydropteroyltriglutamate--homocysteine methyltransferase
VSATEAPEAEAEQPYPPASSFDGGDLDCGNGLLLLIRRHIDPLAPASLLEIRSTEASVAEDLPAWCRLTGNALVHVLQRGRERRFLVSKGPFRPPVPPAEGPRSAAAAGGRSGPKAARRQMAFGIPIRPVTVPAALPEPAPAPPIPPLAVMGVGSWPRPAWLLQQLHERLAGRLSEEAFQAAADDAVRLAVDAQLRAGVDVLTDGEQRRDNYASFGASRLDNCLLIPVTDVLPYVDDPAHFEAELRALDVPADKVRHPAVYGPLGRDRDLAVHELRFVQTLSAKPVKVALPGPYLLTRTMWMECISDQAYADREALAVDVCRVLREEVCHLLAAGAAIVQLDEPVLSEVVFGGRSGGGRSFMCGALSARRDPESELAFAAGLLARCLEGLPAQRLALHVCRGNWSPDERVALSGSYEPLRELLFQAPVGTLLLEFHTPRAGELAALGGLPPTMRLGLGVVNQKSPEIEPVADIVDRAEAAIALLGPERVWLNPDCGFATFADNPVSAPAVAAAKLARMAEAAALLRRRHGLA